MKDLYRSLALAPSASVEAIRERIEAKPSVADAAVVRQVLLNPARKRCDMPDFDPGRFKALR